MEEFKFFIDFILIHFECNWEVLTLPQDTKVWYQRIFLNFVKVVYKDSLMRETL